VTKNILNRLAPPLRAWNTTIGLASSGIEAPRVVESNRVTKGLVERVEHGIIVLSPAHRRPCRRILHVNGYGGRYVWERIKSGQVPGHQLLGCLELVRMGYEVALAEPVPDFALYRRPVPHDLSLLGIVRSWLGPNGIVFCGHNVLYWLPLLRRLHALDCRIVSLLYAREPLHVGSGHAGVLSLTPAGAEQARRLAPRAKIGHLGWGVDLGFVPHLPYNPEWFFSCGIANRDFGTLCAAACQTRRKIHVIYPGSSSVLRWPENVSLFDGGPGWLTDRTKRLTLPDLIRDYYPRSAATLVVMRSDPTEFTANGFTNVLEAMALGQPVIVTRTGALPGEIDVEKAGCGLHVPPEDPESLARAIEELAADPRRAEAMGRMGRKLCEEHYNLNRYARDLHEFFESL
jgi:hypothetical protein